MSGTFNTDWMPHRRRERMSDVNRPPKAADIDDVEFVAAVTEAQRRRSHSNATRWDVAWVLSGHPGEASFADDAPPLRYPEKVVLAKAKTLIRRGIIDGCCCGCRGDFWLTGKGRELVAAVSDGTVTG